LLTYPYRGIGLAVTEILLDNFNVTVVALSRTTTKELRALHDRFNNNSLSIDTEPENQLQIIECDVSNEDRLGQAISEADKKHGRIDGLILNAGVVNPMGRIDSPDNNIDSWKALFDVNFFSLVSALKAAIPGLRKSKPGRVIFVSSGAAEGGTAAWG
jgi:NAD(P)-dependent dehydrogenase (short-subunit alcohol dehydrogenase family)